MFSGKPLGGVAFFTGVNMQAETRHWWLTVFDEKNNGTDLQDFKKLIKAAEKKGLQKIRIEDKSPTCGSFVVIFSQE